MYDYDSQIKRLTEKPWLIENDWSLGEGLFKHVGNGLLRGCLTMIRGGGSQNKAYIKGEYNEELAIAIAKDERLPNSSYHITPAHLPVFKEWQMKIDKMNEE